MSPWAPGVLHFRLTQCRPTVLHWLLPRPGPLIWKEHAMANNVISVALHGEPRRRKSSLNPACTSWPCRQVAHSGGPQGPRGTSANMSPWVSVVLHFRLAQSRPNCVKLAPTTPRAFNFGRTRHGEQRHVRCAARYRQVSHSGGPPGGQGAIRKHGPLALWVGVVHFRLASTPPGVIAISRWLSAAIPPVMRT